VRAYGNRKARPPLDGEALERLVLAYVGRYATTRAKLRAYVGRKLRERGWDGTDDPPIDRLVERMAALGYVDDAAFASARAASLQRRGFGERRVAQALAAAGIAREDAETARDQLRPNAVAAALRFAERRRIGPFAPTSPDRAGRQRAFAAMLRAGHPVELVKRILDARPGEIPEPYES
jgi:regulatory protein